MAGIAEIDVAVQPGGLRDAILFAVGANATHGLRRMNADKRRAVMRLLDDPEWAAWSDREIARRCSVDHKFVGKLRPPAVTGKILSEARTFTTRHGTVAVMDTARIGRKPAEELASAPDPEPPGAPEPVAPDLLSNLIHLGDRLAAVRPASEFDRDGRIGEDRVLFTNNSIHPHENETNA